MDPSASHHPSLAEEGPTEFGKHLLLNRIATGGMAEIYVARPLGASALPELVAIKRMLPHVGCAADFVGMFIDEAKIVCRLNHPNIVRSYEYGQADGDYYIAMELVRGMDLRQMGTNLAARGRRMPPVLAAWICEKVCKALSHAHNLRDAKGRPIGLIHRDVTPHNVLVGFDGSVKLIDFGIAKTAIQSTTTNIGMLKGKICYMSPEQAACTSLDLRSDIFSAGSCLYELTVGDRLFDSGEHYIKTLGKVKRAEVTAPSALVPDVPPDLERVILRALAKDPNDRFQTAKEMAEALRQVRVKQRGGSQLTLARWMRSVFWSEYRRQEQAFTSVTEVDIRIDMATEPSPAIFTSVTRPYDLASLRAADQTSPSARSGSFEGDTQVFFSVELELLEEQREKSAPSALPSDPPAAEPEAEPAADAGRSDVWAAVTPAATARPRSWSLVAASALVSCAIAAAITSAVIMWPTDQEGSLQVRLTEAVPGATVAVDGVDFGPAPATLADLAAGTHVVVVRAEGHTPLVQHVEVESGGTTIVAASLTPETSRIAAPSVAAAPDHDSADDAPAAPAVESASEVAVVSSDAVRRARAERMARWQALLRLRQARAAAAERAQAVVQQEVVTEPPVPVAFEPVLGEPATVRDGERGPQPSAAAPHEITQPSTAPEVVAPPRPAPDELRDQAPARMGAGSL